MAKKSVFDSLKGVVGKIFDDNNEKEDEARKNAVAPKLGVYGPPKVTNRATLNTRPNATASTISGAKQSVATPNFSPVKSPATVPAHNAPRTHIDGTLKTSNSAFGNGAEFKPMPIPKLSSNPNPLKAGNLSPERNQKYGVDFTTASNNLIDTSKFVGNKHADSTFMNTVRANNVKAMKTSGNIAHSDLNIDPTFKIGQIVKPEHGGLNIPNRENAASTTPVTFAPTKASPVKKYDVAMDKPIKESLSFEDSTLSDIDKKSLSPEAFKLIQDYEIRRKRAKHSGDIGEAAELMEQENKIRELSGYSNSDVWDIEQGNIVAASDIDKSHMGAKDLKKIESLKKDYMWQQYMYGIAKSKGDEDAINAAVNSMNSIHKEAQDLRRKYGYTGGKGGTEFRQSEKQKVAYDEKTQKDAPLVTASENLKKNPEIAYDAGSAYDDAYVMMQATDEQKKHYNYLYNTDKSKANKYFDHVIRRSVNADIAKAETEGRERANKEIDENGSVVDKVGRTLGATVYQAVVNPIVGTVNYIGNLGHYARYGEIDHNSPLNQVQKVAAAERQRFSESIDNPALRFTYDAAATALDSVAAAALGGNLGLIAMSTGAANNTLINDLEQGRDTKKAILNSFLAGAMEYFSEKLPFERLTKIMGTGFKGASKGAIKNSKDFVLDIVKQMGIEGSTEVASEIGNNIANDLIYGKKSDRNLYKQQLISEGVSEQEAERQSMLEYWVKNPLYAFALGAVSGGMSYGPMLTKQQLNVGKAIKKDDITAKMLIEKGLELKDSKGKELAIKLSQSSDIKPMQLANLKGYILDETYNKIKPEERQKELTEYVDLPYKDTKNRLVKAYEIGTDRDLEKFATEKYAKAYTKKAQDVLFAAESYDMMTPEERASEQGIALKSDIEEFVNNTSDLYFSDALHPQIREATGNALAKLQDLLKSDTAAMNAVGSRHGNTLTFHANYAASNNIPLVNSAVTAAQKQNVPFNVVQVQPDDHTVKLMYVPQFDTESEPRIESIATVAPDGKIRTENPTNRIITNKADYVTEDYNGFDVKAAKDRENSWKNSGIRYSVGLVNDANYFNQKFGEHLKNDTPVEETEPVETEDVSDVNTNDTVASNTEDVAENTVSDDSNIIEPESNSQVESDSEKAKTPEKLKNRTAKKTTKKKVTEAKEKILSEYEDILTDDDVDTLDEMFADKDYRKTLKEHKADERHMIEQEYFADLELNEDANTGKVWAGMSKIIDSVVSESNTEQEAAELPQTKENDKGKETVRQNKKTAKKGKGTQALYEDEGNAPATTLSELLASDEVADLMEGMNPVYEVSGNEFNKNDSNGRTLKERIREYFEGVGTVHNHEIGDVKLNNQGVHNMYAHNPRLSLKMKISIMAIPDVIKNGKVVSKINNYKGKDEQHTVLVAPVTIKGELHYMGVVINNKGNIQEYWNHKVSNRKGNSLYTGSDISNDTEFSRDAELPFSKDTVPQSNTKSQDVLKMAAAVNDDTNTESSNIGKELNRGAFVNFDNVESNGKTEIARKAKVTGIARKLLPEEGNGSIHDLVIGMQRLFKVPVFVKGVRKNDKALGFYDNLHESISLKLDNDLTTTLHEIGHHLDKRLGINDHPAVRYMLENTPGLRDKLEHLGYEEADMLKEVVADFYRMYMTNPDAAYEYGKYGIGEGSPENFYDVLENKLVEGNIMQEVAGARRRILDYASLDIVDKVAGTIVSREPRRISWQRTRMNMYQAIVSKNAALEWLDKEVDNIARREGFAISPSQKFSLLAMAADNASGYLEKMVEPTNKGGCYIRPDGTIDYDRKTMGDILTNLEKFKDAKTGKKIKYKDVVKHFDEYLKLKHAEDWAKQGKRVFPSDVMSFGDIPLATQRINDMYYRDVVDSETGETTRLTFESIANELYEWWNGFMQDWMVDTKMVDADLYDMLKTLNPHYVPNYRKLDDAVDGERNLSSSTENLMQRSSKEGSTKDTYSPTENLLMKADQIVRGVLKNNTMNLMHEFYNSDNAEIRELMGQFIKEVPTNIQVIDVDMGPVKNRLKKAIKKGKFGEDFSNTSIIDDIVSDTTTAVLPRPFKDQNVLSIKVDGKYVHYYIKQDDDFGVGVNLIKAFQTQSVQHFKTAFNIMRAFTRTWSALTTSSNPLFAISNMIRDYQHGLVFVKPDHAWDVFNLQFRVEYFVTLAQCIGLHVNNAVVNKIRRKLGYADLFDGREFKKQFDLYEAQHGHAAKFMPGQDNLKKALREINDDRFIMRRGMSRAVGMIETFNNIIEQTPRMVAFKRAYKNTKGTEQDKALAAMHAAREATVNFQRRGSGISSVSAVVPFIGVAIAGIDQIGRAAKDCVKDGKPNPEGMARIGRLLATQAIPAVLLMLLLGGDDDDDNFIEKNIREGMQKFNEALGGHGIDASDKAREEYEGFNDYLKQAYWLIKVNGTWIKIPKDREISALFGSSAQLISTMILNPEYRNLDAMESYFNYAAQQFIPPHEMTGWAIVDAANNKTWYGGKILSKSDETLLTLGKEDSSKYREIRDDRTSNIAVAAAHITSRIGLMPDVLKTPKGQQYVIDQLGGGLADVLLPMTTPASTGVIDAIAARYTANPDKQSHYISEAFEIYNDLAAEKDYYNRHKSDDDEDKEKPVGSTWYDIANDTVMGNQRKMNASQSMMDLYTENKGWMHEYGKDLIDKDKFLKLTSENQAEINSMAREFVRAYKKAGGPKFDEIAETGSFAKIKMTDEMKEAGMTESLLKDIEKEMNKVSNGNKANAVAFTDGVNYETYCLYAKAQDKDITDDKLEKNFTYIQKLKSQNMTAKQYADTMDGMKKSLKRGDKSVLTGSLAAELYYLTNPNLTEEQQLTMFEMYNSAENVDAKLKYARIAIANGVTADKLQDLNVALPKDPTKEQIINTALSMGWTKSQVYSYYNFKTKRK